MNDSSNRIQDLLLDVSFQDWVRLGDAAPQATFWQNWIAENPDRREDVAEARQLLLSIRFAEHRLTDTEVDRIRTKIHNHAYDKSATDQIASRHNKLLALHHWWLWAAASIAAAIIGIGYYWQYGRYSIYETAYGQIRTINLPDGSKVTINANSRLRYLDQAQRTVWLEGEAYFDVVHKADHKQFLVRTKQVTVRVLGTAFNVSERPARTIVSLDRGKVQLGINHNSQPTPVTMAPGETISVDDNGRTLEKHKGSTPVAGSWTQYRWVLENTSLQEVAERIELTFGKTVVVADSSLAHETITGVLPTKSLAELLNVLQLTYDVRTNLEADRLTITR